MSTPAAPTTGRAPHSLSSAACTGNDMRPDSSTTGTSTHTSRTIAAPTASASLAITARAPAPAPASDACAGTAPAQPKTQPAPQPQPQPQPQSQPKAAWAPGRGKWRPQKGSAEEMQVLQSEAADDERARAAQVDGNGEARSPEEDDAELWKNLLLTVQHCTYCACDCDGGAGAARHAETKGTS